MKKTNWQPLVFGLVLGLMAGITTVTGLSFFIAGTTDNGHTIGFFVILFLLAAALGGPLAGVTVSTIWVPVRVFWGLPDMKTMITIQAVLNKQSSISSSHFWTLLPFPQTIADLFGFNQGTGFRWLIRLMNNLTGS